MTTEVVLVDRGGHRPPRGYSWEPFQPGNLAAVRSGAYSATLLAARADEIFEEIKAFIPEYDDGFEHVARAYAETLAHREASIAYRALIIEGTVQSYPVKGRPRVGFEGVPPTVDKGIAHDDRVLDRLGSQLGLTPAGLANIYRAAGRPGRFLKEPEGASIGARGAKIRQLRKRDE